MKCSEMAIVTLSFYLRFLTILISRKKENKQNYKYHFLKRYTPTNEIKIQTKKQTKKWEMLMTNPG